METRGSKFDDALHGRPAAAGWTILPRSAADLAGRLFGTVRRDHVDRRDRGLTRAPRKTARENGPLPGASMNHDVWR